MTRSDKQLVAGVAGFQLVTSAATALASPDGLGPEGVKQISVVTAILVLMVSVRALTRAVGTVGRRIVRAVRANTRATRQLAEVVADARQPAPESRGRIVVS